MQTNNMKDNLITEVVKMYAPELARAASNAVGGKGGQGKGSGKSSNEIYTNNNNNKGKAKGNGKGKGTATAFAQLRPCEDISLS